MAQDTVTLNLKVLSPSSEVEGGILLQDLAASTTVKELRLKIQDAVPSKPGPERMRLIYRGKVVANDADTLETVFGADNLRESRDQSLHLVLRELPQTPQMSSTPGPRTATAPPDPFRPAQAPLPASPLQTNPFRAIPQPRPNAQPQAVPQQQPQPQPQPQPHHRHHAHHHAHHPHFHHHHHVQQPLNPLGPMGAMPLPPQMQQQIAQALGQRGAPVATPAADTPTPTQPADGRTVRQEGIGPNGARWSVTYNDFTANIPLRPGQPTMPRPVPFAIPPRPFGSPAPGGVNVPLGWLLQRLRATLQEAAREVDNVRVLLAPSAVEDALSSAQSPSGSATFPSWRAERIREHLRTITHNLNMVESGLSDPAMQLNTDVIALRQTAGEVRMQANEFSRRLDAQEARTAAELTQATSPSASTAAASDPLLATAAAAARTLPSAAARTLPSAAPQELFLLSSPQGLVGVLFDQRGTYTTAPFTSSLSSQTFVDQFNQNRQLIASLGQQLVQSSHNLHNQLGGVQPTPAQQPGLAQPEQPPFAVDEAAAQHVIQNIIQNRDERQAANGAQPADPDAPADNDRVVNVAGHLWLIFKLACFVYIFAGGGGWYRPLMLGSIAIVVYIAQLGVFEAQFNVVRGHFEALLPNAERIAQRRNATPQDANAADARRNVTPEEAARRLLLQQRDNQFGWVRETMRTLERGVAIFVASLWPGIGERMVHAQEERERLERVAASEARERQEEEQRRRAEEAEKEASQPAGGEKESAAEKPPLQRSATQTLSEDFMEHAPSETHGGPVTGASAKGKEKAAYVDDDDAASSS
ncbi:uncharacterized protein M421DRAFT_422084 [Didymella exigua CBS 183.55]|uniref:Ubiquitin-like domain-containing protein n=1 Tax=Didymella exigua CBS 183.55 TaxID=1150837 RepID=A0A6A5RHI5_9PLEO|nr:uncharacterized protein M421DRAFT_422084 [Didymella exigua CBS 183.55]KAF1927232.1 hypothetical protein M421DRAFT_422084 [Didymella exigua CBS 183.55]